MKRQLLNIIIIGIIFFPLFSLSQNVGNKILYKDSVMLDSVKVVNEKFLLKINKFYIRNKNLIDTNTYFVLRNLRYKDSCQNYFTISISLGDDIDNDFILSQDWDYSYFKINNVLVLIRHIEDEYSFNLLFQRTKNKKLFYFNHREYIKFGGSYINVAYYKVITNKKGKLIIRKFKDRNYSPSIFQIFFHKVRNLKF